MDPAPFTPRLDPSERWIPLALKLLLYLWLAYFLYQAVMTFDDYTAGKRWPFMLTMIRTWTFLPIHEAGHFFFRIFGTTMTILGGSLLQVLVPLAWFAVALRQRSHVAPVPLFFAGENIMDVSLYVRDAPWRLLPLLGGHKSGHDWYNLLTMWDAMEAAEGLADVLYFGGLVIGLAAIAAGVVLACKTFFGPPKPFTLPAE
jgi:hypothetical protein